MRLIFLLLALFAIGCALYGIYAGVRTVRRGLAKLGPGLPRPSAPTPAPPTPASSLSALQEAFTLYQQGALTRAEFDAIKHSTLAPLQRSSHLHQHPEETT